jgi:phosphoglycerol transferase
MRSSRLKPELLPALGAAVLATAIGIWTLQLWKTTLQVPILSNPGDELFNLLMIKDVIQHGWDLTNPSLGVPLGQEVYDFPALSGDSLYMVMIKALGVISSNPAVVINLFYLMGFPLIALTTFGVLRLLGISAGVAIVCAVLYAVLPFRFESSEQHVFLSSYFTVPISCYLVLAMLKGYELFAPDHRRRGWRAYVTWHSAAIVALCLVLGSADSYFALFTVALTVPAAILAFLGTRRPRPLLSGLLVASLIFGAAALNELPTVIYDAQHGPNTQASTRLPQESDIYGLSLANMVLPIEGNRIPLLANLANRYNSTVIVPKSSPGSEPTFTNLGLVGTFGLLWLLVVLGISCVRRERSTPTDHRGAQAAVGAGMAFLIGTVGGLATLFAYIVTPQFHAPARICLFIAFFAMFGAALALDQLRNRIATQRRGRGAFGALLIAVLVLGVLYQTSPGMVPPYALQNTTYRNQRQFTQAIESQVPGDASIFQMPYVPFPLGGGPGEILAYEDLYGYIFSNRLRWSGGAMEGRPTNWVPAFLNQPLPQVLAGVSALGFQGIYVDRDGYADHGGALLPALREALGVTPLMGEEGRLAFFNMASYNRRFRESHTPTEIARIATAALHGQS